MLTSTSVANDLVWTPLPPMPRASAGFVVGVNDNRILVAGGTAWENDVKLWLRETYELDAATRHWQRGRDLPSATAYAAYADHAGSIVIAGGTDGETISRDVGRLTPSRAIERITTLPAPLVYAGAASDTSGSLYLVGGSASLSDLSQSTDAFTRCDLKQGSVDSLPALPAGPLILPAVAATTSDVFAFTGANWSAGAGKLQNERRSFAFSIRDAKWRAIAAMPAPRRGVSACVLDDNWILLLGGYGETPDRSAEMFTAEAYVYSVRDDCYHALAPLPYAAIGIGVAKTNDDLFIFGGEDRMKHRSDRAYVCRWRDLQDRSHKLVIAESSR